MQLLGFLVGVLLVVSVLFVVSSVESIKVGEQRAQAEREAGSEMPPSTSGTSGENDLELEKRDVEALAESGENPTPAKLIEAVEKQEVLSKNMEAKGSEKEDVVREQGDKVDEPPIAAARDPGGLDDSETLVSSKVEVAQSRAKRAEQTRVEQRTISKGGGQEDTKLSAFEPPTDRGSRLHLFWGPFNTYGSAQGFANNLTSRVTDVDIRIIEIKPGLYMVAYPYTSEVERQGISVLIEERTGLRLDKR